MKRIKKETILFRCIYLNTALIFMFVSFQSFICACNDCVAAIFRSFFSLSLYFLHSISIRVLSLHRNLLLSVHLQTHIFNARTHWVTYGCKYPKAFRPCIIILFSSLNIFWTTTTNDTNHGSNKKLQNFKQMMKKKREKKKKEKIRIRTTFICKMHNMHTHIHGTRWER